MRLDQAEKAKLDAGIALAMRQFDGLPSGMTAQQRSAYWAEIPVPYQAFYAFEETLAVFGDPPGAPASMLAAFERLTGYITDSKVTSLPTMNETARMRTVQRFTRSHPTDIDEIMLAFVPEDELWAEWVTNVLADAGVRLHDLSESEPVPRLAGESAEPRVLLLVSPSYARVAASRPTRADADPVAVPLRRHAAACALRGHAVGLAGRMRRTGGEGHAARVARHQARPDRASAALPPAPLPGYPTADLQLPGAKFALHRPGAEPCASSAPSCTRRGRP